MELGATGRISSTDVPLINASFQPIGDNVRVSTGETFNLSSENGDGPGNVDPNPPDGATHSGGTDTGNTADFVNSVAFANYSGTGTYNITMTASSIIDFGGTGGVEGSFGPPVVGGDVTIIYTYTPFSTDLSLTKSVNNSTPNVGDDIIYTITLTNSGPDDAVGVAVQDILPSGLTYKSDNSGGAYNSSTGIWAVGNLANGSNTNLQITATVSGTGSITNTAQVSASTNHDPDSTPGNSVPSEDDQDSETITVPSLVDLELDKSVDNSSPDYKDNVLFTITVTNTSTYDNATGVTVTDALPAGLTYISSSGDGTYTSSTGVWNIGTVDKNNGSKSLHITARMDVTGSIENFAQVSACNENDVDSTPNNGENAEDDNDKVTISVAQSADLRIEKTVDNSVKLLGDTATFTITVHNSGPDIATNVQVKDVLPAGFEFISENGQGTYHSSNGIWKLGTLEVGKDALLNILARVNFTGRKTNTAEVFAVDQYDPDSTPNNHVASEDDQASASVTVPLVTDLEFNKEADKDTVNYKDNVVFTLTVTNTSDLNDATGVRVKDVIPAGFTYVSSSGDGAYNPGSGIWDIGTVIKNNGKAVLHITSRADSTGDFANFAGVWSCNEHDIDSEPGNKSTDEDDDDAVSLFVPKAIDLSLNKSVDKNEQYVEKDVTFTLVLHNDGSDKGTGITVIDTLPQGFVFKSWTGDESYNAGTGIWTVGELDKNKEKQLTIIATLTDSLGDFTNTAQVKKADQYDFDSTPDNNVPDEDDQSSASVKAIPISDLNLTKSCSTDTLESGENLTFTLTLTNNGPSTAPNVQVKDMLQKELRYVSHEKGDYNPVTGIWNAGTVALESSVTLAITCTAEKSGSLVNSAEVTRSDNYDPDSTPNNNKPEEDDQDSAAVCVVSGSIGDLVWQDDNGNKIKDSAEFPLQSAVIRLLQNGKIINKDTTDSNGLYLFSNLASGTYVVDIDENSIQSGLVLTTGNEPLSVTLTKAQDYRDADFGYKSAGGSIGDEVWKDLNKNGIRESSESEDIAHVRIMLKNKNGTLLSETYTNDAGVYSFTDLQPDTFLVEIDISTLPLGYSLTTSKSGIKVPLAQEEHYKDADFGAMYIDGNVASIGDFVWKDVNRNGKVDPGETPGIKEVEVILLDASGNILDKDTTDADGCYRFQGLAAGTYIVNVNNACLPQDYVLTTDNNPMTVTISAGEDFSKADFGFMNISGDVGVIGDYTWHDMNWNANQDPDEESLSYVTVSLFRDGDLLQTVKTNFFGQYLFTNLAPGTYMVKASRRGPIPPGYSVAKKSLSTEGQNEDWELTTTDSFYVDLKAGQAYREADFGFAYASENWGADTKKVLARYQPWYTGADNDSFLGFWREDYNGGYADTSLFNRYDCQNPDLAEYQILSAWSNGIDCFVVDWYGKNSLENKATLVLLDKVKELFDRYQSSGFDFRIAVSYNENAKSELDENFRYIADSLFTHPAYIGTRENQRRALFIYNTDKNIYAPEEYRSMCESYLPSGTILIWNNADTSAFRPMDAVYPWVQIKNNAWDPEGKKWGEDHIDYTYSQINSDAGKHSLIFAVGGVWPGFDDRMWSHGKNRLISRMDTLTYHNTWQKVHNYSGNAGYTLPMPWCLIESWNNFNSATEIEPTIDWGYRFNKSTRQHIRIFKGMENSKNMGLTDIGLSVPKHIFQAYKAAFLRPENKEEIRALIRNAEDSFFARDYINAVSYADIAAGLAMNTISVEKISTNQIHISWNKAEHATGYIVYYSANSSDFAPAGRQLPNAVPVGSQTEYTLTIPDPDAEYYVAVTAVDTALGPFANESWYENSIYKTKISYTGSSITSGVSDQSSRPEKFYLLQNFPNPFNPETSIQFVLPEMQHVVLQVYDIQGKLIKTLIDSEINAGKHRIKFTGNSIPSGVYFYKLTTEKYTQSRRMLLVK